MGITENLLVSSDIMGVKNSAPEPNPAITIPLATPFLSGNHSIRAWVYEAMYSKDIQTILNEDYNRHQCS